MITKYYASLTGKTPIEKVAVEGETKCYIKLTKGSGPSRWENKLKETDHYKFCDTHEEAKQWLIEKSRLRLNDLEEDIKIKQDIRNKVWQRLRTIERLKP